MKFTLSFYALAAIAAAAPALQAEAVGAAASPDAAAASCSWTGYGQTNFRSAYGTVTGSTGNCYKLPGSAWENALYSAKVNSGSAICLYTSTTSCSGTRQVIDTAGYRDMTNLPAYHLWKCGSC